jgi:hypothetical protein
MRKASDAAEQLQADGAAAETTEGEVSGKKASKTKAAGTAKVKKPRKKKEPPRMCARWGVFDAAMKQVAIFDFNQREAADAKRSELAAKKNATFFLQIVKEPMPEPTPPPPPPA